MLPCNKLRSICTDLTLEKAKEDIQKECKIKNLKEEKNDNFYKLKETSVKNEINTETKKTETKIETKTEVKIETETDVTEKNEDSDDEEIRKWRERRLQDLKKKKEMKKDGVYQEIIEHEFLPTVLKSPCVVCHFFDKNFKRCEILDRHLIRLANIHLATKFVKIEAKNCLFFMNKLKIKFLPSLGLFREGNLMHVCLGFEDFGNRDDFKTKDLENFLHKMKMINDLEYSEGESEREEELGPFDKR